MSRTTSIAGVRPLGWLARVRAQRKCLAWVCPVQLLGAAGLAPITALGRGSESAAAHGALSSGRGLLRAYRYGLNSKESLQCIFRVGNLLGPIGDLLGP